MAQPALMVGGVFYRIFPVTIPASGGQAATLRSLILAASNYVALTDLDSLDFIVGAKLTDFSAATTFNIFGPKGDLSGIDSVSRAWSSAKGDWTEACTEIVRYTWVQSQGSSLAANLVAYYSKRQQSSVAGIAAGT